MRLKPFDERGEFRAPSHHDGLRRVAVRGAGVTALSQSAGFAVQMIATFVLARLLTPADFGLVAIVTTFSLLLMNVGFNGFTEAIVQRDQMDHALASNVFWINLAIGSALAAGFAAAAPLAAHVYGDARLAPVAAAMSATIVLSSSSVLPLALLKRSMQFARLSANDIIARIASVAVAITLGAFGFGYWALVAAAIALPLTTSIGAWSACRWLPGLPRRRPGTARMVRYAANTYGHFATNYCTRNFDNFLVGWFFGPQSLGFYKKAYDLSVLPVGQLSDPLSAVAVPILSRLSNDPERRNRYVVRALSMLAFAGMGISGCLSLVGNDLIVVLLGAQWQEAGRIFTFFAPGIGAMLLYLTYSWIHLSIGRADRLFRWSIVEFGVLGSLFVLGLRWGPVGVATAWVVSCWILILPALWYAGRPVALGIRPIVDALWRYVAAAPIAVAIVSIDPLLLNGAGWFDRVSRIVTVSLVFAVFYLAAVILLHGGLAPLREIRSLARDILPERKQRYGTTLRFLGGAGAGALE